MGLPPSEHDPESVRRLADEILAQSRYDRPAKSIPDRIIEWLAERLGDLIAGLVGGGGGAVVAWVILIAFAAAITFLLVRYGRLTLPALAAEPHPEVMVELTRSAREWREEAARLESEARWREGLRCRYRALVADLVRQGTIADQAGRTTGEYVRDVVAREPDAAPAFAAATELFEVVWYGGGTPGPAEAARLGELEAQVPGVRV
jgi:hypothetical protein